MACERNQSVFEKSYMDLMKGVTELNLRDSGVPGDLVLIGDHAFPLAMNSRGQVLMAASRYGSGKIVVLGHEDYLTAFPALVENAVTWLRGDQADRAHVGVHKKSRKVAANLRSSDIKAKVVESLSESPKVPVYVTDAYSVDKDPKDLVAFMKAGGGVLIAGQAWSWAKNHPKQNTLLQFKGNKVAGVAGIYFSDHEGEVELLHVNPHIPSSWMAVVIGKDFEDDYEFLLKGVSEFNFGATFSEILVHGPLAFPIAVTDHGDAFMAGAYYGQGRIILISHEGCIGSKENQRFWNNAVRWLDEGRNGVVGIAHDKALEGLSKSGLKCVKSKLKKDLSVYVCTVYNDKEAEEIQDFVAEGGGLLIGGHAWHWAQTHRGKNLMLDCPANKILNKMGLSLLDSIIRGKKIKAPNPKEAVQELYHFRGALHSFGDHVNHGKNLPKQKEQQLKRLGKDCSKYLTMRAHDCCNYTQVLASVTDLVVKSGMPQVCEKRPVTSPKDHMLLTMGSRLYKVSPNADALLPFLVNDNPILPVVYNHKIDVTVVTEGSDEWISTGLYLSPGMKTYMSIPPEMVGTGWKIQIGCQTDLLGHDKLLRAPTVHERFAICKPMMLVSNLWGGLIYLVAPPKTRVKKAEVMVQMAVPAPYYKYGETTAEQWALLRTAPSPWAELEFDNLIISTQSENVRNLENPDELAELWNSLMRAIADLAARPHTFKRKERIVTDVQISHGWMHAGYPIMMQKPAAKPMVDVKCGKNGMWGHIHELGHNQQRNCWEFPPHTTECTCNLWSVYVHEEVLGIDRAKAHPNMSKEKRNQRAKKYVQDGRKLGSWSMWVALETYMQLQDKFGWDAFKKVFAAYHTMKNFPKNNEGRMNLYAETFSETVGMDLTGFFKAWGWPIKKGTENKVSKLPSWNDHPMVQYG